jgi:thymidylate synthase
LVAEIEEGIPVDEVSLDALGIPRRVLCSAMIQRSVDVFVGMPFNIAGYGILTHFLAQITGHMPGTFSHFGCDVHLYSNHKDGVDELIARERPSESDPVVVLPSSWRELSDFRWDEIIVAGYAPKPWIKVPVAV